eukprot:TRINITY_DN1174_c3_g1_i1.p1 TRINITY_DN1174_c3_g1~~TRINITY_DN1174_c3_g1_i1.p1  ORF type:complete len:205 (-),score=40.68 TRINITY_DN1174_c3_g1_i1:279-893(-)
MSTFKVVIVGGQATGKTSIAFRFVKGQFLEEPLATIGGCFFLKKIELSDADSTTVSLQLWDTAGQEKFRCLAPLFYRNSHAVMLVFDCTKEETFDVLKGWVEEIRQQVGDHVVLAIAANKVDMKHTFPLKVAEDFAKSIGASFHLTSAKSGKGLHNLFESVATELHETHRNKAEEYEKSDSLRRPSIDLNEKPTVRRRSRRCGC